MAIILSLHWKLGNIDNVKEKIYEPEYLANGKR